MKNKPVLENLEQCIADAKDGDIKAFESIVSVYQSYVYAIAFRFLYNEEDAEDIVQESFIRIWKHIGSFDGRSKFTTWLYTVVVNLCYDKAKSVKRGKKVFTRLDPDSTGLSEKKNIGIEQEYADRETTELVRILADRLSDKQRMVFLLRDIENMSVSEVSEITHMSESSVKTNLFYARKNIRQRLLQLEKPHDM